MTSDLITRSNKPIKEKPYVEEGNRTSRSKVKIVDLFAGIGGFHYGIGAAAAKINKGVKTLLVSELDPDCQATYRINHKCEVQGDINKVSLRGLTDTADIVTAGFPCQPFSNSGLKLGLSDPRASFISKLRKSSKNTTQNRSYLRTFLELELMVADNLNPNWP